MKINWKIRFSGDNLMFWFRFIAALLIPILAYMGLKFEDFTTWAIVWNVFLQFLSNPVLVIMTVFNAINMVIDPTTKGLSDSNRALKYKEPNKDWG